MVVTGHAIDRYIERVAAVSREDALAAIMVHEDALELADKLGGCMVRSEDGVRYIVSGGAVVTVLGPQCRFNHPMKARAHG